MHRLHPITAHPFCRVPALLALLFSSLIGCTTTRNFNIDSKPTGAQIKVDGIPQGIAPVVSPIRFSSTTESHVITATKAGFADATESVHFESSTDVTIELKPGTRFVKVNVEPLAANITVNGKPMTKAPVKIWGGELEFSPDENKVWTTYRIGVERLGFQKVEKTISGADKELTWNVMLQPMRKSINVSSSPQGAHVYLDDRELGTTPLTEKDVPFTTDPQTNQWGFYKLKIVKPGYGPLEQQISWDEAKADYKFDLKPFTKTVKIVSEPAGATVAIDDKPIPPDASGAAIVTLTFAPDDTGKPRTYAAVVSRKTATSEWSPETLTIAWEEGKTDYVVPLKEIKTVLVPLLSAVPERTGDSWQIVPKITRTIARKDVNEGVGRSQPVKVTALPKDTQIDSLSSSRDGLLVFSVLSSPEKGDLRATLKQISVDGNPGVKDLSDGKSLDLHPCFTADGKEILFSSNRGGKRQSIWRIMASGEGGFAQLTNDQTNDLWPVLDPIGKLYYQGLVDNRSDSRIYMTEIGKVGRTDLTQAGGAQPRLNPADINTLLVSDVNEKTGKRDLFVYPLVGKLIPTNITKTPDSDETDAAWSPNGKKLAFVSDRGLDEDKRNNYDIWVMDLAKPDAPIQITTNGSWDDRPVWSPKGDAIFFRSNRGGEWAIWKMAVPTDLQAGNP